MEGVVPVPPLETASSSWENPGSASGSADFARNLFPWETQFPFPNNLGENGENLEVETEKGETGNENWVFEENFWGGFVKDDDWDNMAIAGVGFSPSQAPQIYENIKKAIYK